MTTELILLLSIYSLILFASVFDPEDGALSSFKEAVPSLAAKVERNITVGSDFKRKTGGNINWTK